MTQQRSSIPRRDGLSREKSAIWSGWKSGASKRPLWRSASRRSPSPLWKNPRTARPFYRWKTTVFPLRRPCCKTSPSPFTPGKKWPWWDPTAPERPPCFGRSERVKTAPSALLIPPGQATSPSSMRRYCRRTAAFTKSSMLWAFPRPPAWRSICPTTASIPKVFTEMWVSFPAAKRTCCSLLSWLSVTSTCCCWTSPPAIWTPLPSRLWRRPWRIIRARC